MPPGTKQYMNNSPRNCSCIRAGANAGAACIRTEMISPKNLAKMRKIIPRRIFACTRASANTGPACSQCKQKTREHFLHILVLWGGGGVFPLRIPTPKRPSGLPNSYDFI